MSVSKKTASYIVVFIAISALAAIFLFQAQSLVESADRQRNEFLNSDKDNQEELAAIPNVPENETNDTEKEEIDFADEIKNIKLVMPSASSSLATSVWVPQTFNNCGPASVSMILQHFGHQVSQVDLKDKLRTNPDDKSVFISEISDLLKNEYQIETKIAYNGSIDMLKKFIANGFYVMVKVWLHPDESIGHNLIIRGYNDNNKVLITDDSYLGIGQEVPYDIFDEKQWKAFNRVYMPVYLSDQELTIKAIMSDQYDMQNMLQGSVMRNKKETEANANDLYAHFNMGTSYYYLAEYEKAKDAFESSIKIGWPPRMLWYQYEPVVVYNKLGQYQKALNLINIGLKDNEAYPEMHYQAALAHQGLGNLDQAKEEANLALKYNANYLEAANLLKEIQTSN